MATTNDTPGTLQYQGYSVTAQQYSQNIQSFADLLNRMYKEETLLETDKWLFTRAIARIRHMHIKKNAQRRSNAALRAKGGRLDKEGEQATQVSRKRPQSESKSFTPSPSVNIRPATSVAFERAWLLRLRALFITWKLEADLEPLSDEILLILVPALLTFHHQRVPFDQRSHSLEAWLNEFNINTMPTFEMALVQRLSLEQDMPRRELLSRLLRSLNSAQLVELVEAYQDVGVEQQFALDPSDLLQGYPRSDDLRQRVPSLRPSSSSVRDLEEEEALRRWTPAPKLEPVPTS